MLIKINSDVTFAFLFKTIKIYNLIDRIFYVKDKIFKLHCQMKQYNCVLWSYPIRDQQSLDQTIFVKRAHFHTQAIAFVFNSIGNRSKA